MSALDRESATQFYVRPAASAAVSATHVVRKVGGRNNAIGIGFLAVCTAVGVLAGTAIAFHSSSRAHPAAVAAPATAVVLTVEPISNPPPAPPPRPIVKPIADPQPVR